MNAISRIHPAALDQSDTSVTIHYEDGDSFTLRGSGYALRCAANIAQENIPDAEWALVVLTKYGHLVQHASDSVAHIAASQAAAARIVVEAGK